MHNFSFVIRVRKPVNEEKVVAIQNPIPSMTRIFLVLITVAAVTLANHRPAVAQVDFGFDWNIDRFHAEYELSRDGSMSVIETIEVTYDVPRHGIFRIIPDRYQRSFPQPDVGLDVTIESITDSSWTPYIYEQTTQNDNLVLKIGDPDVTVRGEQTYVIKYQVSNAVRHFAESQELFWDVNGPDWDANFTQVSADVKLSPELARAVTNTVCFTGKAGSTESACLVQAKPDGLTVMSEAALKQFENMSFAVQFPADTFIRPNFWQEYGSVLIRNAGILLIMPVWFLVHRRWQKTGKDIEKQVVPVYFDPPHALTPAEVGLLADYSADNEDISSTIIDLAIRGFIRIIDNTNNDTQKNRKLSFKLLETDWTHLKQHERSILEGLFTEQPKQNQVVKLSDLKNNFYTTLESTKTQLYQTMTDDEYFVANPRKVRNWQIGLGIIVLVVGLFASIALSLFDRGPLTVLALAVIGGLIIFYGRYMPKRTVRGDDVWQHSEGLKTYMSVAEKDRLAMLQTPGSQYARSGGGPKFTVDLYEKLLPFAVVLGVEKQWSEQFEDLYTKAPDWYQGNFKHFTAASFAQRITASSTNMSSTLSSRPSSSSGSGFSGGSSGGGFGGGGGGAW